MMVGHVVRVMHNMVHVMHMVVRDVVVVMHRMGHRRSRSAFGRGGRSRFLRDGVSGQAEGESSNGGKALDHL